MSLLTDDVALHRPERAEQGVLGVGRDVVVVERFHQVFDQRVKVGVADVHAAVRRLHVFAFVLARAARRLTNLVDEVALELGQTVLVLGRVGEELVNASVVRDVADEIVDDLLDAGCDLELVSCGREARAGILLPADGP